MIYRLKPADFDKSHLYRQLSRGVLYQKYVIEGTSLTRLSRELKCNWKTLRNLLVEHGIHIRTNSESKMGNKNHHWKGGETIDKDGYVLVRMPEHPQVNKNGYILRSRLVMEKHLGRYLEPEEIVHHRSKNVQDDRIENLRLFNGQSEHATFHWQEGDIIEKG